MISVFPTNKLASHVSPLRHQLRHANRRGEAESMDEISVVWGERPERGILTRFRHCSLRNDPRRIPISMLVVILFPNT